MESKKKSPLRDTKNQLVVTRDRGSEVGKMDEVVQGYKPPAGKEISHGNVMYSMVMIVNNTGKLLRE